MITGYGRLQIFLLSFSLSNIRLQIIQSANRQGRRRLQKSRSQQKIVAEGCKKKRTLKALEHRKVAKKKGSKRRGASPGGLTPWISYEFFRTADMIINQNKKTRYETTRATVER